MGLKDEISAYRDADGLVCNHRVEPGQVNSSGNGVLYTSLYFLLLKRRGELTPEDQLDYLSVMRSCEVPGFPGLLKRGPNQNDEESHDDYTGACAGLAKLSPGWAFRILAHGRARWVKTPSSILVNYSYSVVIPGAWGGIKPWLGRMRQVVAHMHWAAGETPPWYDRLVWVMAVAFGKLDGKDQDAALMNWLLIETISAPNRLELWALNRWTRRFQKSGWGSMRAVVQRALSNDPSHPIVRYWF